LSTQTLTLHAGGAQLRVREQNAVWGIVAALHATQPETQAIAAAAVRALVRDNCTSPLFISVSLSFFL
jgi:hypothetical protein